MIVHVNGARKVYGTDWKLLEGDNRYLEFFSVDVQALDLVTVTLTSENQVPDTVTFNIFKDMKDVNAVYRAGEQSTAVLTQQLDNSDDHVYVDDVTKLSTPNLELGHYGIVMIGGERILYRYKHTDDNSVSGLRRGTAGTPVTTHIVGSEVINQGAESYLDWEYGRSWYAIDGKPLTATDTIPAKFLRRAS